MNADGSSLRDLTNNPGFDGWPRWSPDDSKIVFGSNRGGIDYEIYMMNADGSQVQQVTQMVEPNQLVRHASRDEYRSACRSAL